MSGPVFTRTRTSEAPTGGTRAWEYAEQLIRRRHATRAFRPDPVPEDTLRGIFSLAGAAPSNSNAQPWRVEVVGGARRDRLAACAWSPTSRYG